MFWAVWLLDVEAVDEDEDDDEDVAELPLDDELPSNELNNDETADDIFYILASTEFRAHPARQICQGHAEKAGIFYPGQSEYSLNWIARRNGQYLPMPKRR